MRFIPRGEDAIFAPLQINNCPVLSFCFSQGSVFLGFSYYGHSDEKILEITNNEITHSTKVWDAEWTSNLLTIREANRRIILKIRFIPPGKIEVLRGFFHYGNTDVLLDEDILFVANNKAVISAGSFTIEANKAFGISLGPFNDYTESWKEVKKAMRLAKIRVNRDRVIFNRGLIELGLPRADR